MRTRFLVLSVVAVLSVATQAAATPNFPAALQSDLSLSAPPACALCHTDGSQGGTGTVNTPFGKNMRARGLVAYDTGSLSTALAAMESQNVDSAGSCLPDIEELKAGRDPNTPSDAADCDGGGAATTSDTASPEVPAYGCGAEIAPHRPGDARDGFLIAGAFAIAALLRARRRAAGAL